MKTQHNKILSRYNCRLRYLIIFLFFLLAGFNTLAQCPPNIDFEKGNFTEWLCDTGSVKMLGNNTRQVILNTSPPTINRHVMQSADDDRVDQYGRFPINCPNGSGHSIRLGNSLANGGAERVYYIFTIPPSQNTFSLVYNYAIVLEDPGHLTAQQPRLSIEVFNITDNVKDTCSSFDFVVNGGLPGFLTSANSNQSIPVRYKNWSAASINLDGKAGKTFRISFTTTDCALGDHFGYAYIDINSDCSSTLLGTTYCPTDPSVSLTAPPGFQNYRWFDNLNTTLSTDQTIHFNPPPRGGDTVYVEFTPYNGYGCRDTLTAYLWDTLTVIANAGPDQEYCVNNIQLGIPPKNGIVYSWTPSTGLNDPGISNPLVTSSGGTQYTLTATSPGGGCRSTDMVNLVKKCDAIEVYVPNAFSPNSNSGNNRLRPHLFGISRVNYFRVYNRAGQLLYSANSDMPGWDGSVKGKPAAPQTVVWVIETIDAFNRVQRRQGTAILIR